MPKKRHGICGSARSGVTQSSVIPFHCTLPGREADLGGSPVETLASLISSESFTLGILLQQLHAFGLVRVLQPEP